LEHHARLFPPLPAFTFATKTPRLTNLAIKSTGGQRMGRQRGHGVWCPSAPFAEPQPTL